MPNISNKLSGRFSYKGFLRLTPKQRTLIYALLIMEVIAFTILLRKLQEDRRQELKTKFDNESSEIFAAIHAEIGLITEKLSSAQAFCLIEHPLSRDNFATFSQHLLSDSESIQAIEWAPKVLHEELELFIEKARNERLPNFKITELENGNLVPAKFRPEHYPVYYIEPLAGNQKALGFDLASNRIRLEAIERSKTHKEISATDEINLVQKDGESSKKGLLLLHPCIMKGELIGYIVGVIQIDTLVRKAIQYMGLVNYDISVFDTTETIGGRVFPSSDDRSKMPSDIDQKVGAQENFSTDKTVQVADRTWAILIKGHPFKLDVWKTSALLPLLMFMAICLGLLYHLLQYLKSENLLLNMLPKKVADELMENGELAAKLHPQATVVFADFKNFTELASTLPAADLVSFLNYYFEKFDRILSGFKVEKIKTIGDAYLAASGLDSPILESTKASVFAALKMQDFVTRNAANKQNSQTSPRFQMRVGVSTGPVVAGVIGRKRLQYDIWGDTVNTANRLQTHGAVGKVNINSSTYHILKDEPEFSFQSRGIIEVKGKGEMEMWFVSLVSSKAARRPPSESPSETGVAAC